MRQHPHLLEANARIFLRRLSEKHGRLLTLGSVPEDELKALALRGFDLLWLMGVWRRSPGARGEALAHPGLRCSYDETLPGWTDEDVAGSPYAIHAYSLDPALGGSGDLAELRSRLNRFGIGLILDFVPNHLALDHPWVDAYPDRFVRGSEQHVQAHPDWFFSPRPSIHVAHGKDPNFPPWTDTAQVNFFSQEMRESMADELVGISRVADGVRCDMAMLALNDVFQRVWGWVLEGFSVPSQEFWAKATRQVKGEHPGFVFMAEAYWGLESQLIDLGFDFTYDKTLYDRLCHSDAVGVREHIASAGHFHDRAAHFIENHDESRARAVFGPEQAQAAAVVFATLPGLRLFHDGQIEGRRIRLPIQLVREPSEPTDEGTEVFYDGLLRACAHTVFHDGQWCLVEAEPASENDESHRSLLTWAWRQAGYVRLVVVNYSSAPARGRLRITVPHDGDHPVNLRDELAGEMWVPEEPEFREKGIYVEIGPWSSRIFANVVPGRSG